MATKSQARRIIGVLVVAALFLVVMPSRLHAQANQSGTWETPGVDGTGADIYANKTAQCARIMLTVCLTNSPGANVKIKAANVNTSTTLFQLGGTQRCITILTDVAADTFIQVIETGATPGSGTYSVSTPLEGGATCQAGKKLPPNFISPE